MSTTETLSETLPLTVLFDCDETAWLERMSRLVAQGRYAEMDHANLSEYLSDMAKRDRREVAGRLATFLMHLLKWEYQPDHRSGSWRGSILEQRSELLDLLESGTLYKHASSVLARAYAVARRRAAAETGLPLGTFPIECRWDLESLLTDDGDTEPVSVPDQGGA